MGPARVRGSCPVSAIRLLLDEDVRPLLAEVLRECGFDVVAIVPEGLSESEDSEVPQHAVEQRRTLLTQNVQHFVELASGYARKGWEHHGIIVAALAPSESFSRACSGCSPKGKAKTWSTRSNGCTTTAEICGKRPRLGVGNRHWILVIWRARTTPLFWHIQALGLMFQSRRFGGSERHFCRTILGPWRIHERIGTKARESSRSRGVARYLHSPLRECLQRPFRGRIMPRWRAGRPTAAPGTWLAVGLRHRLGDRLVHGV